MTPNKDLVSQRRLAEGKMPKLGLKTEKELIKWEDWNIKYLNY